MRHFEIVFLVHPDPLERDRLRSVIARGGFAVRDFPSLDAFLDERVNGEPGCLIFELPAPAVPELLERLREADTVLPAIMIAEGGDVTTAVRAMRAGASKPGTDMDARTVAFKSPS